ncbi:MAG: potassium transporter [Chromatiales bacterium]|nr:potassium transporter [Chromatiales bacterium]
MAGRLLLVIVGISLLVGAMALAPVLAVSVLYRDGLAFQHAALLVLCLALGLPLVLAFPLDRVLLRVRDGFVLVTALWLGVSLIGAVPLVLGADLGAVDALFESVSGVTTTGATVILGIDRLPPSLLIHRQMLQWIGGIGIIVSGIALLPVLGVGGMQLFKAETPGPIKDEKLTPRLVQTARSLWRVYVVLTAGCALAYWLAGMDGFDAVAHALSTVSTGGFSTHDASLGWFASPAIEWVSMVFMSLGAVSFAVHYTVWRTRELGRYWRDAQTRVFALLMLAAIVVCATILWVTGHHEHPLRALRHAAFEVISVQTSTGFGVDDFSTWPLALPVLLVFISFVGGCAGSTSGGIKVIRFQVLSGQASLHLRRLVHPRIVNCLKIDGRVVPADVSEAVWAYFTLYVVLFALLMLVLMSDGLDQVTAFGAVATCLNNLGPGLGAVATHFADVDTVGKLLLSAAMLLGRLEIFTVLVLLSPDFWHR